MNKTGIVAFYVVSCFVGAFFEYLIGWALRFATGRFIWIYPESPLQTTSLLVLPLWGVAGLMLYALGLAIQKVTNHE